MTVNEKIAPVKDITNPIERNVPLKIPTNKTRAKFIQIASIIPNSNKTMRIMIFANPSFTPGIPMLGINDSKIPMTIAAAVKTPNNAILWTFISNHHVIIGGPFNNYICGVISAYNRVIGCAHITRLYAVLMRAIRFSYGDFSIFCGNH